MVLPKRGESSKPPTYARGTTPRSPKASAGWFYFRRCLRASARRCGIVSAMLSWSRRRQLAYASAVAVVIALPFVWWGIRWYLTIPETCTDGKQNQDERGVDCGGSCPLACAFEVAPYTLQWTRAVRVAPGRYHVVAYFENNNRGRYARDIPYDITLYDEDNQIIAKQWGSFVLTPQPIVAVLHTNIDTGKSVAARAVFTYVRPERWYQYFEEYLLPEVSGETIATNSLRPRAEAILENPHPDPLTSITAVGLVYDAAGNLVAASQTQVDRLEPRERKRIIFTWPTAWEGQGVRLEVVVSRPSLFIPLAHIAPSGRQ
ncbi:MAG: hypothetical protein KatS3mg099_344 [Candidatus Parcubacteria bacterium]|nr:MAG: hypothetical protein KatS3mg099_344 [Candidatus Parcubacteria bacterium]